MVCNNFAYVLVTENTTPTTTGTSTTTASTSTTDNLKNTSNFVSLSFLKFFLAKQTGSE